MKTTIAKKNWWQRWGKISLLRCLSYLKWNGGSCTVFIKSPLRKLEPCIVLWSFLLLTLCLIFVNLPLSLAWNTFVMFGLVLLVPTWNWWTSSGKGYCIASPTFPVRGNMDRRRFLQVSLYSSVPELHVCRII